MCSIRRLLILCALCAGASFAQTPALNQVQAGPQGGAAGSGTGTNSTSCKGTSNSNAYCIPLEPTISGETLIVFMAYDNTGSSQTFALSDLKGDTFTSRVTSSSSANGNAAQMWTAPVTTAGSTWVQIRKTAGSSAGFWQPKVYRAYNVGSFDVAHCNSGTSASITAGSMTPTVSGDLLIQASYADAGTNGQTFTVGSQSNITWAFADEMKHDSSASQWGVYNSTSAINSTFTQGSSVAFLTCAIAMKASASGSADNASNIYNVLTQHEQTGSGTASPISITFPCYGGNFINIGYIGGGTTISSISSSPSLTWTSSGTAAGGPSFTASSQDYYALNTGSTCNGQTITLTVSLSAATTNDTYIVQVFHGPGTWSFDADSGGQTGNQTSIVSSFTTCSSCLTPASANEIVFVNAGWNFCTALSASSPSGNNFDAATTTLNGVNGPEFVDQNNGWLHYYNSGTSAVSGTWNMACDGTNAEGLWAGRAAAFKSPGGGGVVCAGTHKKLSGVGCS